MNVFFTLPSALVFTASGRDIVRFLNARLTNNIRDLAPLRSCLAAALSPQGKTEGFFNVLRVEPDRFILTCDGGAATELLGVLLRFKVADRVEIVDSSAAYAVLHRIEPIVESSPPHGISLVDRGWSAPRRRSAGYGTDLVVPREEVIRLTQRWAGESIQQLGGADAELIRLREGLPEFPGEINSSMLFSECGRRDAVSFTKGCYVGQEVVEKIDSHGRAPYSIRRIVVTGALESGTEELAVTAAESSADRAIGSVLSFAVDTAASKTYGYARIRDNARDVGAATVQGLSCTIHAIE